MRHPGSGPQHSLSALSPSLTDGRGEGAGGGEAGGAGAAY